MAPGSAVDNRVIRLTRLGNKVYLEDVRYEIWARKQSNLQRGVEAASLRTALRAFDIIREGKGGAPIIDITGILVNEVPAGFAPFNIWNIGGKLYVAYAKQDANKKFDVAGVGNGYVSVFDSTGKLLQSLVSGGAGSLLKSVGFLFSGA